MAIDSGRRTKLQDLQRVAVVHVLGARASLEIGYRFIDTNYETGSGSDRFEYDVLAKGPEEGRTTTMPSRLKRRPGRACRSMHGAPGSSAFDATVL